LVDVVAQLKALTALESASYRFSTPLPGLKFTNTSTHKLAWRGIRRPPWVDRLLDLDLMQAQLLVGDLTLSFDQYCFRTAIPVNHGASTLPVEASNIVSNMLHCATDLPPIVNRCLSQGQIEPLALSQACFWRLPFDRPSFFSNPNRVAEALKFNLCVTVTRPPVFYVGQTPVVLSGRHSLKSFPLSTKNSCSDAALFQRMEQYFHKYAMATVNKAIASTRAHRIVPSTPNPQMNLRFPRLWGDADAADQTVFTVMPDVKSMANLLASWRCIAIDIGQKIPLSRSHLLVGDSILKQVYLALPGCPGGELSHRNEVGKEPIVLSTNTPAAILQLALDLRAVECGCVDCLDLPMCRTWSIGSHVTGDDCPDIDTLEFACFHDPTGPRVRSIDGVNVDIAAPLVVQSILRCLSPPAQDYLRNSFFHANTGHMLPMLAMLCVIARDRATGPCSQLTGNVIPLELNESRYNNSNLRFIWNMPACRPDATKAELQEHARETEEHATGCKRKRGC
jgi:hypothetical protein